MNIKISSYFMVIMPGKCVAILQDSQNSGCGPCLSKPWSKFSSGNSIIKNMEESFFMKNKNSTRDREQRPNYNWSNIKYSIIVTLDTAEYIDGCCRWCYDVNTWLNGSTSEWNLVRSPLSHLMELGTSSTTTPPGKTRSLVCDESISINLDLQTENLISLQRSYPWPITFTAFSAAIWGSKPAMLTLIMPIIPHQV